MNMGEIVKDAVRYPFLGIKNVLILAIIIFIGLFVGLTSFFLNGYGYRIIKSSMIGEPEPPAFNNWGRMLLDGVKVFMVSFGYAIPIFLIIIVYFAVFISFVLIYPNNTSILDKFGLIGIVAAFISITYVIIITPIFAMALVHMANNNDKFNAAFRFREILNKIANLGWKNLIKWYLTIIISFVITIDVIIGTTIISNILHLPVQLLSALILAIQFMYICRSATLFYNSESRGYLICEKCGGYYELQSGESPKDFDKCQCGGKLKYTKSNPNTKESEDLITDKNENKVDNKSKLRLSMNFKKNKDLIIVIGLLILTIIPIFLLIHPTLPQTSTNYTLLGTYNASNLNSSGKNVTIPQGTTKIKIDYNLSTIPNAQGPT